MTTKSKHSKIKIKNTDMRRKIMHSVLILVLAFFVTGCVMLGYVVITTPVIDPSNIYSKLAQTSVIYDDQGQVIENIDSNDNRTNVSIDKIPKNLVNAVISIEDKTFYTHHGFNYARLMGAVVDSIINRKEISGTSTITQQLARNLYLTKERSIIRKMREAYYTVQLEHALTKDQIMEAYLNTIYFGFNSNGVQTAAQSYFSKDVGDLTLAECATLAAIPKDPTSNAPLKRYDNANITSDNPNIVSRSNTFTVVYNNGFVKRQHQILDLMLQQKMISQQEHDQAYSVNMKTDMNPNETAHGNVNSYFSDYLINQVKVDLKAALNIDDEKATSMLYNGGLRIYSTMNVNMQKIAEDEFEKRSNFPSVTGLNKDGSGNVIDSSGNIILYNLSKYFDTNSNFVLSPSEYQIDSDGNMTLFGGKRLNFYKTESANGIDYSIEFKNLYRIENGIFYVINGGNIIIDPKYKKMTDADDLVIDKSFFKDNPNFFNFSENGTYIDFAHYTLRQNVVQPQAAMVITDWRTGAIKAMMGGRSLTGSLLYNRATNTRQPGSSIKPIAVYGPALESGVDEKSGWTAGSIIDDAPNYIDGKLWPKNWYSGYKGHVTLRTCVEQSINVAAVKVIDSIGFDKSIAFMKGLGITSITKDDYNSAALGLGGMTKGISPIEMTAAYGAFPNGGLFIAPTCYTKVLDADGNVILEKVPETNQAMNKGVAFIMTDILRTSVSNGIAKGAAISGQPSAGKTGTTTNNYDAWFVGFTPQYSAALWIGNDVNVQLDEGSPVAAALWGNIMGRVCDGLPRGNYDKPDNIEYRNGEYYVAGTYGTGKQLSSGTSEQQTEVTASGSGITGSAVTSGEGIGTGGGTTNAGDGIDNGSDATTGPDNVLP